MGYGFAAKHIKIFWLGPLEAAPGGLAAAYLAKINIKLCS
jgi:hypothetical protein